MTLSPRSIAWTSRLLLGGAVLVTLAAAFVVAVDWRGNRDWRRTEANYAARHESLRLDAFTGPAIREQDNLFRAPVWADLTSDRTPDAVYRRAWAAAGLDHLDNVTAISDESATLAESRRQMIRVGLLSKNDAQPPARAVLSGLKPIAPFCGALRTAVRERPFGSARTDPPFHFNDLRLGAIYRVVQVLTFRARIELAAGQPKEAFEDAYTALRIARACEVQPATIMQALVAQAIIGRTMETLKNAFAAHLWTDPQIAALQAAVIDVQNQAYMSRALRAERAWVVAAVDAFPTLTRQQRADFRLPRWAPSGWLQENKVSTCAVVDREIAILGAFGTTQFTPALDRLQRDTGGQPSRWWSSRYVAGTIERRIAGLLRDFCLDVDAMNGALLAMSLERSYLAAGHYPDTLTALTPMYLPTLPRLSDGGEFGYQPTGDRTGFQLHETPNSDHKPRVWTQPSPAL